MAGVGGRGGRLCGLVPDSVHYIVAYFSLKNVKYKDMEPIVIFILFIGAVAIGVGIWTLKKA